MSVHSADIPADAELHLTIIRADGTRIPLGRAAVITRNPIKRAWWSLIGTRLASRRIHAANRDAARRAAPTQEG